MKKVFTTLIIIISINGFAQKATNTWQGGFNTTWGFGLNWSLNHVPTSSEDVVIPGGLSRYPNMGNTNRTINSLTIESGGSLTIPAATLTVTEDVTINGQLNLSDDDSKIVCVDLTWGSGSTAQTTGNCQIHCYGNWEFSAGANVHLDNGYAAFYGSANQYIRSKDADCYFNQVWVSKSGGFLANSSASSATCKIKGNVHLVGGYYAFKSFSDQTIQIGGYLANNDATIEIAFDTGTIEFTGNTTDTYYKPQPGDHLNNLIVNTFVYELDMNTTKTNTTEILGNVTINSGTFDVNEMDLLVGGNWNNFAGSPKFNERQQKVTFNGNTHQYCSDEEFYTLEIDKPGGAFRLSDSDVECEYYDWTDGAIDVLSGSFTANDIIDNGIAGSWYVNDEVHIHQTNGHVDLLGDVHINDGGEMHVYGGDDDSYWPFGLQNCEIEMEDGGNLKFHDVGIYIHPAGTLISNFDGGTIEMEGDFRVNRADFIAHNVVWYMQGTYNNQVEISQGAIHQLTIDKYSAKEGSVQGHTQGIYSTGFTGREGKVYNPSRGNIVSVTGGLNVHHLVASSGIIDVNGNTANVSGSMVISWGGELKMTDPAGVLNVNNLEWRNGSTANITTGEIYITGDWYYQEGAEAQIGPENTTHFVGSDSQGIYCHSTDAAFGSVVLDNGENYSYLHPQSTEPMHVSGTMDIISDNRFLLHAEALEIDGETYIESGSELEVYDGGQVTANSIFSTAGYFNLGEGAATFNSNFIILPDGKTRLWSGSLQVITGTLQVEGTFNMGVGLLEAGYFTIHETATANFSHGTIRAGAFRVYGNNIFNPTSGTVEVAKELGNGQINCHEGNSFNDLIIDGDNPIYGVSLVSDIMVNGDLTIKGGKFEPAGHAVEVSGNCIIEENGKPTFYYNDDLLIVRGDITWQSGSIGDALFDGEIQIYGEWTFENGTQANIDEDHTVSFMGSTTSEVIIDDPDATFGNIEVAKKVMYTFASDHSLKCNADITIAGNGELVIWSEHVEAGGDLVIEEGGIIELKGTGSMEVAGEAEVYGSFLVRDGTVEIESYSNIFATGSLNIENGSYIVNYPTGFFNQLNGTLVMYGDGLLEYTNSSLTITESAECFISGGTIRIGSTFDAGFEDTFEPDGGTVEMTAGTPGGMILCNTQNRFRNLVINDDIELATDIRAGTLNIESGFLDIDSNTLVVYGDIMNNGGIDLSESEGEIYCYNTMYWNPGSSGTITAGEIHTEHIVFEGGTAAAFGTGNTTYVTNNIISNEDNARFGNLVVEPAVKSTSKNRSGSAPIRIDGNCTFTSGTDRIIEEDWYIQGVLDIVDGASVTINDDHSLNTYSDFDLNGILDLGTGGLGYVDGDFDINPSGELIIEGGELTSDSDLWSGIFGTLTMTDGILELHTGLEIGNAANINITGGTIRVEYSFEAQHANSFQPSGGTVEFYGFPSASIKCNSGNFFNNLRINKGASVISYVRENISVSNDLIIDGGIFRLSELDIPKDIAIGGNVEINTGGKMLLDDSGQITLENEGHLNVNNGGVLEIFGAPDNKAKLTGISGNYFIDVWSGGVISAEHVIFEKMSADGLNIHQGATINPVYPLNHCTFQTGAPSGTMLTINNDQTLTIENVSFYSDGQELYNVTKTNGLGNITFVDANGDFAGVEYENDPYGRVNWLVSELSVDPGFLDFLAPNGINFLNVYSNTTWVITDDMDWLGLNLDTPSGNQVVQVSVAMNNTGMVRTGEITVETEDGSIKIIIPVTQQPFVEQIISLPAGWSGLSSYALPGPPFIEDVFSGIEDDLVIALTETGLYYPAENVNTISMWEPFSAYKIKMETATDLEIYGSSYPVKTMNIPAGWSMLPVISECPVDVEDLFAPVIADIEIVKEVAGYGIYWPTMGINTLGTLNPGKAYYVLASNAVSVTFGNCLKANTSGTLTGFQTLSELSPWKIAKPSASSHSIALLPGAIQNFEKGSIIGAFDTQGNCFGATVLNGNAKAITIFGDDELTTEKDGFKTDDQIIFKLYQPTTKEEMELLPEFDFTLPNTDGVFVENGLSAITAFKAGSTGIAGLSLENVRVYPNPSHGTFEISGVQEGAEITIRDIHGQVVFFGTTSTTDTFQVDIQKCNPGIYMIEINKQGLSSFHKIVVK